MCRLALFNEKAVKLIEKKYGFVKYLDVLEKSCGGHGNGILLIKDGKIKFCVKGKDFTNKMVKQKVTEYKGDYDYLVYHTRIASKGSIKNTNCHPYWSESLDFALCMNGTENEFGKLGNLNDITDTEVIFKLLDKNRDINIKCLNELNSRFIGFRDGKVFVSNSTHQTLSYFDVKGAMCIASEFPSDLGIEYNKLKNDFWVEGEELEKGTSISLSNVRNSYYHTNYYDDPWINNHRYDDNGDTPWLDTYSEDEVFDVLEKVKEQYSTSSKELKLNVAKSIFGGCFLMDGTLCSVDIDVDGTFILDNLDDDTILDVV